MVTGQKNNLGISAMDYMFISPDLQHKDPMRNAFTKFVEVDMNRNKHRSQESVSIENTKRHFFRISRTSYAECY
jgi:hypothetical protein